MLPPCPDGRPHLSKSAQRGMSRGQGAGDGHVPLLTDHDLMEDRQAPQSPEREAKVITLCGSTKFEAEFAEVNQRLTIESPPSRPPSRCGSGGIRRRLDLRLGGRHPGVLARLRLGRRDRARVAARHDLGVGIGFGRRSGHAGSVPEGQARTPGSLAREPERPGPTSGGTPCREARGVIRVRPSKRPRDLRLVIERWPGHDDGDRTSPRDHTAECGPDVQQAPFGE